MASPSREWRRSSPPESARSDHRDYLQPSLNVGPSRQHQPSLDGLFLCSASRLGAASRRGHRRLLHSARQSHTSGLVANGHGLARARKPDGQRNISAENLPEEAAPAEPGVAESFTWGGDIQFAPPKAFVASADAALGVDKRGWKRLAYVADRVRGLVLARNPSAPGDHEVWQAWAATVQSSGIPQPL